MVFVGQKFFKGLLVSSHLGSLIGLQSYVGGAAVIKAHLGWTSKMAPSHGWHLMLAINWDLSCIFNQNAYARSPEHSLSFLTARRPQDSWTSYMVAHSSKHKCVPVTKVKVALEFTQCLFG